MEEYNYTLELHIKKKPNGHMRVYGRGISPFQMKFENVLSFRIRRYRLDQAWYTSKDITRGFLVFQCRVRKWLAFKKKVFGLLRKREMGLATHRDFIRYLE